MKEGSKMSQLPLGMEYTIEDLKLPNLQSAFQLFGAHLRNVSTEWSYPQHVHPLFEINLVLEGEQRTTINKKEFVQQAGDLLIIRPGETHASHVNDGSSNMVYFCLHFDIDDTVFRQLLCSSRVLMFNSSSEVAKRIRPALDKLIHLSKCSNPFKITERMKTSAAFDLCAGLSESLSTNAGHSSNSTDTNRIQIAGRIAEWIEQSAEGVPNTSDSMDQTGIQGIVKKLGYSASYCNRIFHQVYGMSPRQYMSAIKLRKAKLLLVDQSLSIENIAIKLGYKDIAHFSRQFKRWTHVSPSHYRQSLF
jgi:AraC family transcriptional activator of pobA